jgi:uncharacterized protein (TIGR02452 family)
MSHNNISIYFNVLVDQSFPEIIKIPEISPGTRSINHITMASSSRSDIPTWLNKGARAKLAKETINSLIPKLLKSHALALNGIKNTELIRYSPNPKAQTAAPPANTVASSSIDPSSAVTQPPPPTPPRIRVVKSDTLDAVQSILASNPNNLKIRVAALNMASSLRPGGGVLSGAVAQEETLCMRSTLYASLSPSYYRLPEDSLIYSPSILVFRSSSNTELPKSEWYYTDIISCAALRTPDVVKDRDGRWVYEFGEDKEMMVLKVRLILQVAKEKGVTHLVLGALGCGAYRNPPEEVAKIFRRAILGDKRRGGVTGIEEIVFAIFDEGENMRVFREVFGDGT